MDSSFTGKEKANPIENNSPQLSRKFVVDIFAKRCKITPKEQAGQTRLKGKTIIFITKGIMNMLNGIKAKAFLIGTLAVSFLISGCGVKKDSYDRAMLVTGTNITEVTSAEKKKLLDQGSRSYWQYDPND